LKRPVKTTGKKQQRSWSERKKFVPRFYSLKSKYQRTPNKSRARKIISFFSVGSVLLLMTACPVALKVPAVNESGLNGSDVGNTIPESPAATATAVSTPVPRQAFSASPVSSPAVTAPAQNPAMSPSASTIPSASATPTSELSSSPGSGDTSSGPFQVTYTSPAASAADVTGNQVISATFNRTIDPTSITDKTFTLTGPGTIPVVGIFSNEVNSNTVTFDPVNDLEPNVTYTATIKTGAKDIAGNQLVTDYVWTFTTKGP
jgi:hypothetical protein